MDGEVTEYPLADRAARPHAITCGPDGRLWFTEWGVGRIGVLGPDGQLDGYRLPGPAAEPHGIAVGPDGAVYAALERGSIARSAPRQG